MLNRSSRAGFTLLPMFILCLMLAILITALVTQTLMTLQATDRADEALRQSLPNAEVTP